MVCPRVPIFKVADFKRREREKRERKKEKKSLGNGYWGERDSASTERERGTRVKREARSIMFQPSLVSPLRQTAHENLQELLNKMKDLVESHCLLPSLSLSPFSLCAHRDSRNVKDNDFSLYMYTATRIPLYAF